MAAGERLIKAVGAHITIGGAVVLEVRFRIDTGGAMLEADAKYFTKRMTWDEFVANTSAGERSTMSTVLGKLLDYTKANPPIGMKGEDWSFITSGATIE